MKKLALCILLILIAGGVAAFLRFVDLNERVMHTDEAVHAYKFGELLEDGVYIYDKNEYHGPTLNYFSLAIAKFIGVENTSDVSDAMLRWVPGICGVLLVLLIFAVIDGLGCGGAVWSAMLAAISGAFVYYSRYYIQEMLLVCFTFGVMVCGYRYAIGRRVGWAIGVGVFAGLMFATKETCIIAWGSMFVAACGAILMSYKEGRKPLEKMINPRHIAAAVIAGVVVSVLFFSSFFSNWAGVADSVLAYGTYFDRAGGGETHVHPWYFYFRTLLFWREGGGPVFTEASIVVLAVVGFVTLFKRKYCDS